MKAYDVLIVGGGFAGVAAALAAAREGSRVLLIEQAGSLGGAAVNNLVFPYMPNSTVVKKPDGTSEKVKLTRGIFDDINRRLAEEGQFHGSEFNESYLKVVLDRMMREAGVEVLFHAVVVSARVFRHRIRSVDVAAVGEQMTFEAECFVDATGDANLAALAGCRFSLGRDRDSLCQPMTLCFRVVGVDWDEFVGQRNEAQTLYREYQSAGKIQNPREDILFFRPLYPNGIHFNSTRVVRLNPTDPFELSRAEAEAREQMVELFRFLKENITSFADAEIIQSAASIGVRESRMVLGEHRLTGKELVDRAEFPDAIAAGNYEIDIHNPEGSGTSHYFFPVGQYYTIPYRSLVAKDVENLLVGGRCISCDHEAQASVRIMPICCSTGEAAGVGAAMTAKNRCAAKDVKHEEIRRVLMENGAFIG